MSTLLVLPALFTQPSILPNFSLVSFIQASTESALLTSTTECITCALGNSFTVDYTTALTVRISFRAIGQFRFAAHRGLSASDSISETVAPPHSATRQVFFYDYTRRNVPTAYIFRHFMRNTTRFRSYRDYGTMGPQVSVVSVRLLRQNKDFFS